MHGIAALLLILMLGPGMAQEPPRPAEQPAPPLPLDLVIAKHLAESTCEDPASEHMSQYQGLRAQLGPTSALYAIPCTANDSVVTWRLYAHESGEIGGIETLLFAAYSPARGWYGTNLLEDIIVDGPRLTATFSNGVCSRAAWTWSDYSYRLDRYSIDESCSGRPPEEWTEIYPPR